MRVLFSLEGGRSGWTRRALARLQFDTLHLLTPEPDGEEVQRVVDLVERSAGRVEVEAVPEQDLLGAFHRISEAMRSYEQAEARLCQVNAGPDENLLSAAALLACLHEGVEAHFLHEAGHTVVPVLTKAPLSRLLSDGERDALGGFPDVGRHVAEVQDHDPKALQGLKKRALIELEGDRLVLTGAGRALQTHLGRS